MNISQDDMNSKSRASNEALQSLPSRPPSPPPPPRPPNTNRSRLSTSKLTKAIATTPLESSEFEELQRLVHSPPFWKNNQKTLSKQLSMCETPRDKAWEKRRRQISKKERKRNLTIDVINITDEDFSELKGSIELGFGFNEEGGQQLCNTLPALDLYLAVNRQLSPSPVSTPQGPGSHGARSSCDSATGEDPWKICGPGENPQQVKTKLRYWAQAVACSVKQSF